MRKPRDEQDQEATTSPGARAAEGQMMLQSHRYQRPAGAGTAEEETERQAIKKTKRAVKICEQNQPVSPPD